MLQKLPFLDFILTRKHDKSIPVPPLQFLSAVALTDSRDIFNKYVHQIPPNVFPFLFQATIQNSYLKVLIGEISWFSADSIHFLIEFWPYEVLTLREHLVGENLTRKSHKFTSLNEVKNKFFKFLQGLVDNVVDVLIFGRATWKSRRCRIQRLDVSQMGPTIQDILHRYYCEVSTREDLKKRLELAPPCELVCDIFLNDLNISKLVTLLSEDKTSRISSTLSITFNKISAEGLSSKYISQVLSCTKRKVLPKFLGFNICKLTPSHWDNANTVLNSLNGLCLSYCFPGTVSSNEISFLRRLTNLDQLDISGIHSRDGWAILSELPKGLTYLKIAGCFLEPKDLEGLVRHTPSLREIDLSHNSFNSPEKFAALATLLCSLEKVEVIELQDSRLGSLPQDMLVSFLHHFSKSCPNVKILQLRGNDFPVRFMSEHLIVLAEKESLRFLSLTAPSDVYLSDDYREVSEAIACLKNTFVEKVKSLANSQLRVEWNEDASLSRWYYASDFSP